MRWGGSKRGRILRKNDVKGVGEGTAAGSEMRPTTNLGEAGASEHAGGGDWVDAITSGGNHRSEAGGREESGSRETLKDKVEDFFDCQFDLFIEFTGLISWTSGASIGWHSDDNRPYLKQRDFTAVCYLNSYGGDFKGGLFHFKDGEPTTIKPLAGDVAIFTADSSNIHSVDEIADGERLTLTLWFSRDASHDEDARLVSLLSQSLTF
ncbi:hypothetical protein CMV_029021 [Castanea mollissima]|uniref:procollagen-proline 3-dioxygenase n=1 Tax=Castanea mollissima TaxID=60419 RepID=A0A8J4Q3W1_9ROSI|nr:hypothetical protein CMV_029021 [Castanea mollissima]